MSPAGGRSSATAKRRSEDFAMTIASMTGFARTQGTAGDLAWVWEMRSVNNKGLDLRLRLPSGFEALDQPVRKLAGGAFARGSVSLNLQVQRARATASYRINEDWLATVLARARQLASQGETAPIRPDGLLALRGVIEAADENADPTLEAEAQVEIMAGAEAAVLALLQARGEEGQALKAILTGHLDQIASLTAAARATAATQPAAIQARLLRAVGDVVAGNSALPEERIAQEVAMLAAKADVREELDRLEAHIAAGRDLIGKGEPCGRKLEFLSQEFNREANTLCSKSQDIELTRIGLDLKATIDQVREQVANVE
jgi:uncharacterized protein (TIGR00255 family)